MSNLILSETEVETSKEKVFLLSGNVAMAIMNIVQLCMLNESFNLDRLDAGEEIMSLSLVVDKRDPTGTSLTVNPAWLESFNALSKSKLDRMNLLTEQAKVASVTSLANSAKA